MSHPVVMPGSYRGPLCFGQNEGWILPRMRPVRCSPLPPLKSAKVFSRLDLAPDFGSCSGVKYSFYWVEQCKVFILNGLWLVRHEKATSCAVAFRSPISILHYSRLAKLTRHSLLLNNMFILFIIARFVEGRGLTPLGEPKETADRTFPPSQSARLRNPQCGMSLPMREIMASIRRRLCMRWRG